jgi:L-cysteate sulfo-lyase
VEILANETLRLLEVDAVANLDNIAVDDQYVGEGYGKRTAWGTEAIQLFAKMEGIFLDHVYSGKGAAALIDYARKSIIAPGEHVLFVHTGGNVQLFA